MAKSIYTLGARPVDRKANGVLGGGDEYAPFLREGVVFKTPPPPRPVQRKASDTLPKDLRGITWGRLTVVSYWGRMPSGGKATGQKWVCRCSCGNYLIKSAKSIYAKSLPDKCVECDHLIRLQKVNTRRQQKYMRATLWDAKYEAGLTNKQAGSSPVLEKPPAP